MNQTTYYKVQQVAYKRSLWIILLTVWMFCSYLSTVHAQEHVIEPEIECQLCLTNFSHTPALLSNSFHFTPNIQKVIEIDFLYFQFVSSHKILIGNRGPPLK